MGAIGTIMESSGSKDVIVKVIEFTLEKMGDLNKLSDPIRIINSNDVQDIYCTDKHVASTLHKFQNELRVKFSNILKWKHL